VDRSLELENLRRSLAMLTPPGPPRRCRARRPCGSSPKMELQARLERLRVELRQLVEESQV